MNHRKTHSQGFIPFSWEEKPGISKFNHQKSNSDMGLTHRQDLLSHDHMINIAPPPPCTQPTRKSYSGRTLRWQDDPFLAALKSCTKSTHRGQKKHVPKEKKSSVWSCMQSCDVESDHNIIKFSRHPPIPKERYNAKTFVIRN